MVGNASLNKANIAKQDEFYTQLTDIEKTAALSKAFQRENGTADLFKRSPE